MPIAGWLREDLLTNVSENKTLIASDVLDERLRKAFIRNTFETSDSFMCHHENIAQLELDTSQRDLHNDLYC